MRKQVINYLKYRSEIRKRKTFSLYELQSHLLQKLGGERGYSEDGGYNKLVKVIKSLQDENKISVIKNSSLNGKNPPLKTRWRILKNEKDTLWNNGRFFKYSDLLNLSFYQRNPKYQSENEWQKIKKIYSFLKEKDNRKWASIEERSLELFDDEKYFYSRGNRAILNRLGLKVADLKAKKYGEMFIYWKNEFEKTNKILILENHSTFFSCKRVLQKGKNIISLNPDTIIYGEGKKIIKSLSFLEEITDPEESVLYYFGDLDPEGFLIYRLLKERYSQYNMQLYLPLYRELLRAAGKIYPCHQKVQRKQDLDFVIEEFTKSNYNEEINKIKKVWQQGGRIAQELITYEYLINL